jgi:hypothetical protein
VYSIIMCLMSCTRKIAGQYWRNTYLPNRPELQWIDANQKADVEQETPRAVPIIKTRQELGQLLIIPQDKGAVRALPCAIRIDHPTLSLSFVLHEYRRSAVVGAGHVHAAPNIIVTACLCRKAMAANSLTYLYLSRR